MNILALDLGSKCGWAWSEYATVLSGVEEFYVRKGQSPGIRYLEFLRFLDRFRVAELVAYEEPHLRGGHAAKVLSGFATHLESWCAEHHIEHSSVHTATLKKFATGSGRADKSQMLEAARARFPSEQIADDNQADALLILAWAEETCGGSEGVSTHVERRADGENRTGP